MKMIFKNRLLFFAAIMFFFAGCSASKHNLVETEKNWRISFLAGGSFGGIVENNELVGVDGTSIVDGISGATRKTVTIGIHTEVSVGSHNLETGLDWLNFDQSISYNLPSFSYYGRRDISFHQLSLPLVCNFDLTGDGKLSFKIGASIGYTISKTVINSGILPSYKFKDFDYGGTIGLTYFPIENIGIFTDIYRGSQIYNDVFHSKKGMGGQSYVKFGIIIRP